MTFLIKKEKNPKNQTKTKIPKPTTIIFYQKGIQKPMTNLTRSLNGSLLILKFISVQTYMQTSVDKVSRESGRLSYSTCMVVLKGGGPYYHFLIKRKGRF